jgi:signal transduction histidine kinase/phage shock protein PspC (stress-responsive transcriptional regulator)
VAAGLAEHLGVSTRAVRVVFVALGLAGGFGLALYGAYWVVLPVAPNSGPGRMPVWMEYVVAVIGAALTVTALIYTVPFGSGFVPLVLGGLGAALLWRQASETDRERWRRISRSSLTSRRTDRVGRIRLLLGGALVVAGAILALARADITGIRDGLLAVAVTIIGVALLTGPWWMRMASQLGAERSERIRSQERAEIAAHLHDSVLQTLALIQRNADSPREVTRLARGQERQLRDLLYGPREAAGQLAASLRAAAAEVEDAYAVKVDVVLVGDAPLSERLAAAAAAAREAMLNAGKHAGVTTVSLYAEVEDGHVRIYVKDRGVGFDLKAVPADRQGVRGSIVGRIERHGGKVEVRTAPGSGTEVEITMPREQSP